MIERVRGMLSRFREIEHELAQPETVVSPSRMETLGRKYRAIGRNLPVYREYLDMVDKLEQARGLLKTEHDMELLHMAREEIAAVETRLPSLEEKVKNLLVPRDPDDAKNAIVEIRAGTGGIEAGIFAADLYRMYAHYLEARGWTSEIMAASYGELDAIKEVICLVEGEGAYGALKFESGVHRVQRVPKTEAQGRIHTSAASVAVFPEADELEVQVNPEDLRIDVYRAGGAGGQHVNKTESAVRITHNPTGIVVVCQDEKSQHKNKSKAMKVLLSRLYDRMVEEKKSVESAARRSMVSTGDRSAKIRTYNFPQGRITDHRINFTIYELERFMNGDIQKVIDALEAADLSERLKESVT